MDRVSILNALVEDLKHITHQIDEQMAIVASVDKLESQEHIDKKKRQARCAGETMFQNNKVQWLLAQWLFTFVKFLVKRLALERAALKAHQLDCGTRSLLILSIVLTLSFLDAFT